MNRFFKAYIFTFSIFILMSGCCRNVPLRKWSYYVSGSFSVKQLSNLYNSGKLRYDVVSITGPVLRKDGTLEHQLLQHDAVTFFRKQGKVVPLIAFKTVGAGITILKSNHYIERAVSQIKLFLHKNRFNHLHLDLEYLSPKYADRLAVFLKTVKEQFTSIKVSMAIFPPIDFPVKWSGFHDLGKISPYLDEVVLMAYDYHRQGTSPGPVTDVIWSEKNIKQLLKFFNAGAVWLGVPGYGYIWGGQRSRVILADRWKILKKRYKGVRHSSGNYTLSFVTKMRKYQTFFSDTYTIKKMTKLASRFRLKGTAFWRMGFEESLF